MNKVLVFGIFDGIHPGHINFFKQAKRHGDILVVAVGQESAVKKFKNKLPKHSLEERIKFVQKVDVVTKAIPGDREQGSYKVIEREKPDIICLGYDQEEMEESLEIWVRQKGYHIPIKILRSYKPEKFHTKVLDGYSVV